MTVAQKGTALVAVPLLFQFVFLLGVAGLQREHGDAEWWAAHTKDVIARGRALHATLADAHAGVRGYVITGDPAFAAPFDRALADLSPQVDALDALVRDNPDQVARVRAVRAAADSLTAWQRGVVAVVARGDRAGAAEQIRTGRGNAALTAFREELDVFLDEEERLDRERVAARDRSRSRVGAALTAGAALAAGTTLALTHAFRRGLGRRFAALGAAARRLAAGETPPPPLGGDDEIAAADRALRAMAADLTRAAGETRRLNADLEGRLADLARTGAALRASEEQIRLLVGGVRDYAIVMLDPGGRVVSWNAAAEIITGYTAAEAVGHDDLRLYPPEAVERGGPGHELAAARSEGRFEDEGWRVRKDGTRFWANVVVTAIRDPDGVLRGFSKVTRDVTARKQAEDEVRRLNDELEARVRERTAELEATNRDLAAKNAENEMFVYSVSHDLRSPLVNLQGFSKELDKGCGALAAVVAGDDVGAAAREKCRALLDGKFAKSVGFIQAAVLRLSGIIDALLRLSRAGRVEYRWEVVDVAAAVARVVAAAQGSAAERGAAVRVGPLPPAWGDRTAVEQVFGNLVGNALAYLDPARPGEVEVGCLPGGPGGARTYYVRDNGLGIPAAHQARIFQAFQRAHPGVGAGEGLGLAIVARVAERHRGRAWVESAPGEGSTFYVTLPAPPGAG